MLVPEQKVKIFRLLHEGYELSKFLHQCLFCRQFKANKRDWGLGTGDWGLGTGDWGLGTGDWGLGTGD
ncbi:hypothetical protein JYQ62_21140 [Nostoc sp. UHCC 0702]|nr:hypothetical protein JYQ62_21140 [Nostoc sp. UHCC 0702]